MKGVEREIKVLRNLRSGPTPNKRKVGTAEKEHPEHDTPKRRKAKREKVHVLCSAHCASPVRVQLDSSVPPLACTASGRKFWAHKMGKNKASKLLLTFSPP